MIILRDKPGQLCNRLWSASLFLDLCIRNDIRLFAPYHFVDYAPAFDHLAAPKACFLSRPPAWLRLVLTRLIRFFELSARKLKPILKHARIYWLQPDCPPDELVRLARKGVVVIDSFKTVLHQIGKYRIEDADRIRPVFRFNPSVSAKVDAAFACSRDEQKVLVGVHIRRRDYINFRGGQYYYPNETYRRLMSRMQDLLAQQGLTAQFLLCSDEPVSMDDPTLDWFSIEGASAFDDLQALSRCRYIMGPPSSFSNWAAFAGKSLLYSIPSADSACLLTDFKPVVFYHTFADGSHFKLN